jgi:hypothetical protein
VTSAPPPPARGLQPLVATLERERAALAGPAARAPAARPVGPIARTKHPASAHAACLRALLRARRAYPVRGAPLGWAREACAALHRRSIARGEVRRAAAVGPLLASLSVPAGGGSGTRAAAAAAGGRSEHVEACTAAVRLMVRRRQWERAARAAERLIPACARDGLHAQRARLLLLLASVLARVCPTNPAVAAPPLLRALALADRVGLRGARAACVAQLAGLHARLGAPGRALEQLLGALPFAMEHGGPETQGRLLLGVAEAQLAWLGAQVRAGGGARTRAGAGPEAFSDAASPDAAAAGAAAADGGPALRRAAGYLEQATERFVACEDASGAARALYLSARVWDRLGDAPRRNRAATSFCRVQRLRRAAAAAGWKPRVGPLGVLRDAEGLARETEAVPPLLEAVAGA